MIIMLEPFFFLQKLINRLIDRLINGENEDEGEEYFTDEDSIFIRTRLSTIYNSIVSYIRSLISFIEAQSVHFIKILSYIVVKDFLSNFYFWGRSDLLALLDGSIDSSREYLDRLWRHRL